MQLNLSGLNYAAQWDEGMVAPHRPSKPFPVHVGHQKCVGKRLWNSGTVRYGPLKVHFSEGSLNTNAPFSDSSKK